MPTDEEKLDLEKQDPNLYQQVMTQLENVIDPELGVDIVNLGLIYHLYLIDLDKILVEMTLTTPFCLLSDQLESDIKQQLLLLETINEVSVELTFFPPWSTDNMTRFARLALGIAKR